jgi:molybdopterin-guanine dinucleotide biosynthesis protein A
VSAAVSVAAVVLAGGESRRFGFDKLAADVDGTSVLDHAIAGLPADVDLIVVGPVRTLSRPARFVREQPVGGGPAAAMIAGLQAALVGGAAAILILPGDTPAAGDTAMALLAALDELDADPLAAVVAADDARQIQPLQLALRPAAAEALIMAAGEHAAAGESARNLLDRLPLPPLAVQLPWRARFDIDTQEQLQSWRKATDH